MSPEGCREGISEGFVLLSIDGWDEMVGISPDGFGEGFRVLFELDAEGEGEQSAVPFPFPRDEGDDVKGPFPFPKDTEGDCDVSEPPFPFPLDDEGDGDLSAPPFPWRSSLFFFPFLPPFPLPLSASFDLEDPFFPPFPFPVSCNRPYDAGDPS